MTEQPDALSAVEEEARCAAADDASPELEDGATPAAMRPSRTVGRLLVAFFLSIAVAAALAFIPLPYVVLSPGPVTNTLGTIDNQRIIDVTGTPTYPTSGKLYFTTVRLSGGPGARITAYDLLAAWVDSGRDIRPEEAYYPQGTTRDQVSQVSAADMENSQEVAAAVAARAVGKEVPSVVRAAEIVAGSPAEGLIKVGDQLISVDGKPVTNPGMVRSAVRSHKAGTPVQLVVRRDGTEVGVAPVTQAREGVSIIGVSMATTYDLPIDVKFHAGAVGGPSAGMMFALAIYDLLTPGELTGGKQIAGTGTISDDGAVGPIGGIAQKVVGAKEGGAAWFLAPADNCADLVGHVPQGLQVVKVATFDEARSAVEAIGSGKTAGLPSCPS